MEYFKQGYFGHCGYLYVFPANKDESVRYGYVGDRNNSAASFSFNFMSEPMGSNVELAKNVI